MTKRMNEFIYLHEKYGKKKNVLGVVERESGEQVPIHERESGKQDTGLCVVENHKICFLNQF